MHVARTAILALVLVIVDAVPSSAQVITFDDLPANTIFLPQGYRGFNWLGGTDYVGFDPTTAWLLSSLGNAYQCPTYCQLHHPVSGTQNAWGNAGSNMVLSRSSPFDLLTMFLAGTDLRGGPLQIVRGFYRGTEIYTMSVALDPGLLMQHYTFNFLGVDEVRFDGRNGYGNLLLDDIAYYATPEPTTLLLTGSGLVSLVGVRRLRRRHRGANMHS